MYKQVKKGERVVPAVWTSYLGDLKFAAISFATSVQPLSANGGQAGGDVQESRGSQSVWKILFKPLSKLVFDKQMEQVRSTLYWCNIHDMIITFTYHACTVHRKCWRQWRYPRASG